MATQTEKALVESLAQVMTLAESLIAQLGEIAKVYDAMPDDIKRQVAKAQVGQQLERQRREVQPRKRS